MSATLTWPNAGTPIAVVPERPASGDGLAHSRAWLNTHNGMGEKVAPAGWHPRQTHPDAIGDTHIPGQLWERVGERRKINYDVYPWRARDAVAHLHGDRGPVAFHTHSPSAFASGIIRAGQRVK